MSRILDGPVFTSVSEVAKQGALYVRGTAGEVQATELDGGGNFPETQASSLPVRFVALTVSESSQPDLVRVGSTVSVLVDPSGVVSPDSGHEAVLRSGQDVVVVAVRKTTADAPGIESVTSFLAPVGGSAGVFEISNDTATAQGASVTGLSANGDHGKNRLTVPLGRLISTIEFALGGSQH